MHDLLGAEEVADPIAIIHRGCIEQVANAEEIFFNPRTKVVREFIETPNILNCEQSHIRSSGLIEVVSGDMRIVLPYKGNAIKNSHSPRDAYISPIKPHGPALNRYKGQVSEVVLLGSVAHVSVLVGGNPLLVELSADTLDEMNLQVGQNVYVITKLRRLRYLEAEAFS